MRAGWLFAAALGRARGPCRVRCAAGGARCRQGGQGRGALRCCAASTRCCMRPHSRPAWCRAILTLPLLPLPLRCSAVDARRMAFRRCTSPRKMAMSSALRCWWSEAWTSRRKRRCAALLRNVHPLLHALALADRVVPCCTDVAASPSAGALRRCDARRTATRRCTSPQRRATSIALRCCWSEAQTPR
jgi:hypothetical protein